MECHHRGRDRGGGSPFRRGREVEGWRWMEVRMEEEGESQRAEPRERRGMTNCARGPALRNHNSVTGRKWTRNGQRGKERSEREGRDTSGKVTAPT